jgi:GntR family transcriptional regulator, arabinose operon transcriptional repressor
MKTRNKPFLDTSSGIPLYLQLMQIIEDGIDTSRFQPGKKIPSENEVVNLYGVSRATARQAYQKLVDRGALVKIKGKGTYVAQKRKYHEEIFGKTNRTIAFIMRDMAGGVQPHLIKSVSEAAFHAGYSVTVNNTGNSLELALEYVKRISALKSCGVIFRPLSITPYDEVNYRICEELQAHRLPFVFLDLSVKDVPAPCVRSDNFKGGELLGAFLRKKGHEHVFVVTNCFNPNTNDRIAGFQKGFGDLVKVVNYYDMIEGDFDRKVDKFMQQHKSTTAVFAMHDLIARKLYDLFNRQNRRVPDDISIVGFDDIDFAELLQPSLTTVHQNLAQMGKNAVAELLELLENPEKKPIEINVPVRFIQRLSVRNLARRRNGKEEE